MTSDGKYYCDVRIGLSGTWKNDTYTYSHTDKLAIGDIVKVPFGKSEKIGFVANSITKPSTKVKPITNTLGVTLSTSSLKLLTWIDQYYPAPPGTNSQLFLPSYLVSIKSDDIVDNADYGSVAINHTPLTAPQEKAFKQLSSNNKTAVLYGITGSGKTRVYAELAAKAINKGQDVLILYPEISLSAQTDSELSKYLPSEIIHTYHSKRTKKSQRLVYQNALSKTPGVFIGARSSLFLPFNNLGLVIIDEAHDSSYKQDNGNRYNGLYVAAALASIHKCKLILGSATPPISETKHILDKGGELVEMKELAKKTKSSKITSIVDMKNKTNKSSHPLLSNQLIQQVNKTIGAKKQSLLFLNKRGTARLLSCDNCGWFASCPRCDAPTTFHHDRFQAKCHLCGFYEKAPINCPDCGKEITLKNLGIKSLENDLARIFPNTKIARFDSDNSKDERLSEKYREIKSGKYDIIVGTQIITKGLDLPKLETVGILQADSSLLLPDFNSEERTFQQLLQVSGRVGRGHSDGKVVVQTYQPSHPLFKSLLSADWRSFYINELNARKDANYPPYQYAMRIIGKGKNSESIRDKMTSLNNIFVRFTTVTVLGPAPSFYEKIGYRYVWQTILLSNSRSTLSEIAKEVLNVQDIHIDLDPVTFI